MPTTYASRLAENDQKHIFTFLKKKSIARIRVSKRNNDSSHLRQRGSRVVGGCRQRKRIWRLHKTKHHTQKERVHKKTALITTHRTHELFVQTPVCRWEGCEHLADKPPILLTTRCGEEPAEPEVTRFPWRRPWLLVSCLSSTSVSSKPRLSSSNKLPRG